MTDGERDISGVVDTRAWLRKEIARLLEAGEIQPAVDRLNQLLGVADDTETKLYCYENLGILAFRAGKVSRARGAFAEAASLMPEAPGLSYALGHCAAASGQWWRVYMHAMEAIHGSRDASDEAEFMRLAAIALQNLGQPEASLSMFLGALDRCPENPWILDSIAHFYADQGRFFEALDTQEALIDVLASVFRSSSASDLDTRPDVVDRIVRRFMSLLTIQPQDIEERARGIYEKLRSQIGVVAGEREEPGNASVLMSMNLPAALHRLIDQLADRDRNFLLLETAQSLWALGRHDRLDVHLSPFMLAASIHVVAERKHWRVETPVTDVANIYGVEPDALTASVRLLVGCFEVNFVELSGTMGRLTIAERRRCEQIQRALLFGVDVSEVSGGFGMLGC